MRKCSVCKIEKELENFHRKGSGYSYMCKECRKTYIRNHYQSNKTKYIQNASKSNSRFYERYKLLKASLKCSKCNENHPAILDFHHTDPSKKEGSISKFIRSTNKFRKELDKCIVLCSNCHRKLHWEEKRPYS